ncbi:Gag-like protein, partial [Coprinopsis marcescibilis]
TVYFNIWDSLAGTKAKALIGKPVYIAGWTCTIQAAKANPGAALCQRCWCWGHPSSGCTAKAVSCADCSRPHDQAIHRQVAGCCKGNPKGNPPVALTPASHPCPHKRCVNCRGNHAANDLKCPFWGHCFDSDWIKQQYAEVCQR